MSRRDWMREVRVYSRYVGYRPFIRSRQRRPSWRRKRYFAGGWWLEQLAWSRAERECLHGYRRINLTEVPGRFRRRMDRVYRGHMR